MAVIYENRKEEIKALQRHIHTLTAALDILRDECDNWEKLALRAIYELNKTPQWMHLTLEDLEAVLRKLENLETPKA